VWKEIEKDDAIRATIVTGAGKVAFSAGADLGKLIPLFTGARKPEDEWDRKLLDERGIGDIALLRGYNMDKPVISAVSTDFASRAEWNLSRRPICASRPRTRASDCRK